MINFTYLKGNPFMTLYAMFEVIAKRSRSTLRKLMPSAVLFWRILVIWGTFTAKKGTKPLSKITHRNTIQQILIQGDGTKNVSMFSETCEANLVTSGKWLPCVLQMPLVNNTETLELCITFRKTWFNHLLLNCTTSVSGTGSTQPREYNWGATW
jgi:hypothetical protein